MKQKQAVRLLINHIENTEYLYNVIRNNVKPNLDRKRQAGEKVLKGILANYLVKVARNYAEIQDIYNWKRIFSAEIRDKAASALLEHYKYRTAPFGGRKTVFETPQPKPVSEPAPVPEPEPEPEPVDPFEQFGDMSKLIRRYLFELGDAEDKKDFYRVLKRLSKAELILACEHLELDISDSPEELRGEIVKYFYGDF